MAWNGSGTFTRTNGVNTGSGVWTADRDASVKITASRHDTHDQDLAAGINACLAKNGENAMTGDLNLGTNDITNGGAATFSGAFAAGATTITGAMTASGAVTGSTVSDATGNVRSGRRNLLINGGFDVWQRATSQTSSGYGSADRWSCEHSGTTKTASRQTFTLGQTDVPGNPKYWARHVVTTSAGASNYARMEQRIESVLKAAGQTVTVSFYAKADSSKNIAVDLSQNFGTGGSPSSAVTGIGAQKFALTTSWQRFTASIAVTSITGKTLGSNGDDYLAITFWFDAGSSFNSRTDTLGQQSGTFDIANVQLEIGSAATTFEALPIGETEAACKRYYQVFTSAGPSIVRWSGYCVSGSTYRANHIFSVEMRANPTVSLTASSGSSFGTNSATAAASRAGSVRWQDIATGTANAGYFDVEYTADSEL